jgi:hypothetical protein
VVLAALLGPLPVPRVGAQADLVRVSSRTIPEVPEAGDDVTVLVRATGCPPGGTIVELYRTSDDGATTANALMARDEPPSTLFFRVRAEIELPNAIEGWYGVRVVCGQFRPDRAPMANTTFRIGPGQAKQLRLSADVVTLGQTLRLDGTGCPGTTVEYDVTQSELKTSAFLPNGSFPVAFDGSWGGDVDFSANLVPGPAQVRARCLLRNQFGDQVVINYDGFVAVDLVRPTSATAVPAAPGP